MENKRWIDKDGNFWGGVSIVIDDIRIWNPSDEQLIEAGYTEYIPPTPPEPTPEELKAYRELRDAALEHSRKTMSPIIARYL